MRHPVTAEHTGMDLAPHPPEINVIAHTWQLAGKSSIFTQVSFFHLWEHELIYLKEGKEWFCPPVSGMIQSRVILLWTACHTWSTGSLCGLSVVTYGVAACQDGRKPCHILYTGKSFLNGNCVRVSWPGIADHRKMEFIQKRRVCGKTD